MPTAILEVDGECIAAMEEVVGLLQVGVDEAEVAARFGQGRQPGGDALARRREQGRRVGRQQARAAARREHRARPELRAPVPARAGKAGRRPEPVGLAVRAAIRRPTALRCSGRSPASTKRPATSLNNTQNRGSGTSPTVAVVSSVPARVGTGSGTRAPRSRRRAASQTSSDSIMAAGGGAAP